MGSLLDALRSVEFLASASPEDVVRFMSLGRSIDLPKGHLLWQVGAEPREIVIPVGGEAETQVRDEDGRELIDRFIGPAECIGLMSAMDGLPHPQEARVVRTGEFFIMGRTAFLRFIEERPGLRPAVMAAIGRVYRRALVDREDIAFRDVSVRVARFLLRRACVRQDDGARVLIHATQSEIASRLGSVREVVARTFAGFAADGLVTRTAHGIFISDWHGLCAQARTERPCGDDPAVARARTERYFLPMRERRRRRLPAEDVALCREFVRDLTLCRVRRCPAALGLAMSGAALGA
jgi:CRP-like cAMP-binding protein